MTTEKYRRAGLQAVRKHLRAAMLADYKRKQEDGKPFYLSRRKQQQL